MKKMYLAIVMALVCSLSACGDNNQVITFAQMPEAAQAIVKTYFDAASISYVMLDNDLFDKEYEVRFNDGSEMAFEKDGSLKKVDSKYQAVPEGLIPAQVLQEVKLRFPQCVIVEWGKDDRGWKAELNNKLELKFNSRYDLVGFDD